MSITGHDDTDAISSIVQMISTQTYKENEVYFAKTYGGFTEKSEVMVDMNSLDFPGIIYDHHGNLLAVRQILKDKLAKCKSWHWFDSCASIGIFNLFKKEIPRDLYWLHIVGAVADHVPHYIKFDEWQKYPELLEEIIYLSGCKGIFGKADKRSLRVYYLSKWINTGRYIRQPEIPLHLLLSYDLEDIIMSTNEELLNWKDKVDRVSNAITTQRENSIIRSSPFPRICNNSVFIWCIKTKVFKDLPSLRVHSRICSNLFGKRWKLGLQNCKVFVVVNLDSLNDVGSYEVSVRGENLTKFLEAMNLKESQELVLSHLQAKGLNVTDLNIFLDKIVNLKFGD